MTESIVSVRWGKDVQPYVSRLASRHINDLRKYCEAKGKRILKCRKREIAVVPITARVTPAMVNGRALHRFRKLGFHFQLNEAARQSARRRAFVLNFATKPKFRPEDMPPRLRREDGKALSARPRKAAAKKLKRVLSDLNNLWVQETTIARTSRFSATIAWTGETCVMLKQHIAEKLCAVLNAARASRQVSAVLMSLHNCTCSARARLMEILTGESVGPTLGLDTMVAPPTPWDAWLFGELPPPEIERRAA